MGRGGGRLCGRRRAARRARRTLPLHHRALQAAEGLRVRRGAAEEQLWQNPENRTARGRRAACPSRGPTSARAQGQTFPTRFVGLVVPFPPGGGTDAIARVVSGTLSSIWGQQMVVENKGGGATSIGTDSVAKADPDGYTVLLQSMPLAVNKFLFKTLPYDPVADLAPVSLLCDYPNVMAVAGTTPRQTLDEVVGIA